MRKIFSAVFLIITSFVHLPGSTFAGHETCLESEFHQFQRDIPSLYLINGLSLTEEQIRKLVSILQQAKSIEDKAEAVIEKIEKKYQRDIDKAIEKTMDEISAKGKVDRHTLKSSRSNYLRDKTINELSAVRTEKTENLDALADEAYGLLTPSQQEIVASFKPCFIPSRDFRDPIRVGQAANDTSTGENILSKLREVPEDKMDEAKKRVLDDMVPHLMYKRHIKYSEKAAQKAYNELSERLEEVLPQALALSDIDFELQKSALSKDLLPLEEETKPSPSQIKGVVKTYLLNTGNIEVLKSRLKED